MSASPTTSSSMPSRCPARYREGSGQSFDWKLLSGRTFAKPWFLSGGLNPENVSDAAGVSGARFLDVSSGVERTRGEKDAALIGAFLDTVRAL